MEDHKEVILIDTHVLIWLAREPKELSHKAAEAIKASVSGGGLAIAAITLWELAWLATHGRIAISGTPEDFVDKISARTAIRPVTPKIAVLANQFPATYPNDPCDRLIGATALADGIALITKDARIRNSRQINCIW